MKINIDLSASELTSALDKFKADARELTELRETLNTRTDQIFNLREEKANVERTLEYTKDDLEIVKGENPLSPRRELPSSVDLRNVPAARRSSLAHHDRDGQPLGLGTKGARRSPDAKLLLALIANIKLQNRKINAIKIVRHSVGCGLKRSKGLGGSPWFRRGLRRGIVWHGSCRCHQFRSSRLKRKTGEVLSGTSLFSYSFLRWHKFCRLQDRCHLVSRLNFSHPITEASQLMNEVFVSTSQPC